MAPPVTAPEPPPLPRRRRPRDPDPGGLGRTGEARLLDFALRNRDSSAQALRQALFEEIDRWSAGQEREDDQTLVIVRTLSSPPPGPQEPIRSFGRAAPDTRTGSWLPS